MNPAKIAKMDDEVQKWSRKDPMAIREAMVYPEHLEALERGEMKHGSLNDSDVELDTEDSEPEQELDETMLNYTVPDLDSCDDDEIEKSNRIWSRCKSFIVYSISQSGSLGVIKIIIY